LKKVLAPSLRDSDLCLNLSQGYRPGLPAFGPAGLLARLCAMPLAFALGSPLVAKARHSLRRRRKWRSSSRRFPSAA